MSYDQAFATYRKKHTKTLWKLINSGKLTEDEKLAAEYVLEIRGEIDNVMKYCN